MAHDTRDPLVVLDSVDKWFLAFKTRLRSHGIPDAMWVEKFVECPSVPEHLKSRVREAEGAEPTHAALRQRMLTEFGPIEPVAYYKRQLHHLHCATATEAKERISVLLELHNRAAVDHEEGKLLPRSLCYCFIDALPQAIRQHLEANYALAAVAPQPLEQIFEMAKAQEAVSASSVLLAGAMPDPQVGRKRARTQSGDATADQSLCRHRTHRRATTATKARSFLCVSTPTDLQPVGTASDGPSSKSKRFLLWLRTRVPISRCLPGQRERVFPMPSDGTLRLCLPEWGPTDGR